MDESTANGLLRVWQSRVEREFRQVCFQYRVTLQTPWFVIEELSGKWGRWDPISRCISLSRHLIENYPWDSVVEIIKHEMAHQYCSEILGIEDQHGPRFKEACQILGVAEWARRAQTEIRVPTGEIPAPPVMSKEERLLQKTEKLLALAGSANSHEALLAMQKVQDMYAKYQLSKFEHRERVHWIYHVIHLGKKRVERYQTALAALLGDFYFVRVIHINSFNAKTGETERALEILGTRENTLMAEYVFRFVTGQLGTLWQKEKEEGWGSLRAKNSFYLGVISGFREKLEMSQEKASHHKALVLANQELDAFVRTRYPRIFHEKGRGRNPQAFLFHRGKEVGRNLVLNKAVHKNDGFLGRLLGKA